MLLMRAVVVPEWPRAPGHAEADLRPLPGDRRARHPL